LSVFNSNWSSAFHNWPRNSRRIDWCLSQWTLCQHQGVRNIWASWTCVVTSNSLDFWGLG
jgi:hypothetical protein